MLAAIQRLGDAPELYAVTGAGGLEPIALSNRRQAWTAGARWALANRWDGGGLLESSAAPDGGAFVESSAAPDGGAFVAWSAAPDGGALGSAHTA